MKRSCEYCGKQFESKRSRRCCDRTCAAKLAMKTKGRSAWSASEEALIERIAGTMPMADIIKKVRSFQRRNGLEVRTETAVKLKLKRMGESRKCTLDNLTQYELSRMLGISFDRVRNWTRLHNLPYKRAARNQFAIKLSDVRELAERKPHLFAGIEWATLMWLLDDEKLADSCLKSKLTGLPMPVKRLDTGEVFPSIKEAAGRSYVTPGCIQGAIKRGGRSAGTQWELVS
jgi:hypothetical protein